MKENLAQTPRRSRSTSAERATGSWPNIANTLIGATAEAMTGMRVSIVRYINVSFRNNDLQLLAGNTIGGAP